MSDQSELLIFGDRAIDVKLVGDVALVPKHVDALLSAAHATLAAALKASTQEVFLGEFNGAFEATQLLISLAIALNKQSGGER